MLSYQKEYGPNDVYGSFAEALFLFFGFHFL
jgi:hypothetical protein